MFPHHFGLRKKPEPDMYVYKCVCVCVCMYVQVRRLFPHHFGLRKKPEAAWLGVDPRSLILLTGVAVTLALFVALELLPLMQVEGCGVRGRDLGCGGLVSGAAPVEAG